MPTATEEKAKFTKSEIEAVKEEIRQLYSDYRGRRLELGLKLLQLQDMLAYPGKGTFVDTVTREMKIPKSTVYDTMDFARAELDRIGHSENRKDDDNTSFDWDEIDEIMRQAYPEDYAKHRRKPTPYVKSSQLHLILDRDTRLALASAWKTLQTHKALHKKLCFKIAREIIRAAAKLEKSSK